MPPGPPQDASKRLSTTSTVSSNSSSTSSSSSSPTLAVVASPRSVLPSRPSTSAYPVTAPSHAEQLRARSATPLPASSAAPVKSRSGLLSRLMQPLPRPLQKRNRSVVDFHVRCDEPYRKYSAGDSVRGAIVLIVVKPFRLTHLVVSLHGYVRVFKDPTSIAKAHLSTMLPQGGSSSRPQYRGNGLATLFQDEQILSGEGRLEPGKYEFGFDLVFPDKDLPSSIDFERGTISYMVTATLTRPTSISPTSSCDRRVMLAQMIDIGVLPPPSSRTIFLEPISKRTRRKRSATTATATTATATATEKSPLATQERDLASEPDVGEQGSTTDETSRELSAEHRSRLPSDVQSEVSGESNRSAGASVSRVESGSQGVSAMTPAAKQQVVDDKTITATIELLKGGFLPGDTVSVRVTIRHIKRIKSMTGVIVTLFRQAKIDTSPPPSFAASSFKDGKRADKEERLPRSRAGLVGLSFSSTGSTSVFRKDLDQNAAPLFIDPATMQATVTVSVKVPDDAFPTIRCVPGDIMSFKYQVEVVVDLGGKLASQLQGGFSSSRHGASGTGGTEQGATTYGPLRMMNIADTAQMRRNSGVISVTLEAVVGSTDSSQASRPAKESSAARRRGPQSAEREDPPSEPILVNEPPHVSFDAVHDPPSFDQHLSNTLDGRLALPVTSGQGSTQNHASSSGRGGEGRRRAMSQPSGRLQANGVGRSYLPLPQLPQPTELSEKDQIRFAEMRLLPSQPSVGGSSFSVGANESSPSRYAGAWPLRDPEAPLPVVADAGPSAPTEMDLTAAPTAAEDKQELERRRLMNEASAPPEFPADMDGRDEAWAAAGGSAAEAAPSAPMLIEDEDGHAPILGGAVGGRGVEGRRSHAEQLPAYVR